jgi:hypothetical protein
MTFIAGKFAADEILCQIPPHTLRIDLQARRWKSDNDPDAAIVDSNENGIPIEFILLGFTPFFGNLGMRTHEEFIRIAYIGVSPSHRLLPPRCVTTSIISGKSSQKNFISYFQNLYNNRINVAEVVTSTKFVTKSFNERDPVTGADGAKINFNCLEFKDRPANGDEETSLVEDISKWLGSSGGELVSSALASHISGSTLVQLPLGEDHAAIKEAFVEAHPKHLEGQAGGLASLPAGAGDPATSAKKDAEPPKAKAAKSKDLTDEQKQALKDAGLEF